MHDVSDNPDFLPSQATPARPARAWPALPRQILGAAVASLRALVGSRSGMAVELVAVVAWGLVVAAPLLDFSNLTQPIGLEYSPAIASHYIWRDALICGPCALWNGSLNGGSPALADPYGSMLHPLVMVPTLIFGVPVGAKLATAGAFILVGLAQWWLALELRLGTTARLWSAALAVAAGHMAGRLQYGVIGMLIATASVTLALPPLLRLIRNPTRRAAALLGLALALAIVAGQGYMQLALLCSLPAALLLVEGDRAHRRLVLRRGAEAAGIGLLLAAPMIIPIALTWLQLYKTSDPEFRAAQPMQYLLLNLVVDNYDFFNNELLDRLPYPYLYINYIGWLPLVFAAVGFARVQQPGQRRVPLYLAAVALISLWIATADPQRLAIALVPHPWLAERMESGPNSVLVAGMAVVALIPLAAIGVDRLARLRWPRLHIGLGGDAPAGGISLNTRWLLVIPLAQALIPAYAFGQEFIQTQVPPPDYRYVPEALVSDRLRWVSPIFGEPGFVETALRSGLKLSPGFRPWNVAGRPEALPEIEGFRGTVPEGYTPLTTVEGITLARAPGEREYASVTHADGSRTVCTAHGVGGMIDVSCPDQAGGPLQLFEYSWSGWYAWVNGQPVGLQDGPWLKVELPPGSARVELRYLPWDVPLGLALALVGLALAAWRWRARAEG